LKNIVLICVRCWTAAGGHQSWTAAGGHQSWTAAGGQEISFQKNCLRGGEKK
jgi:hypothetical protein